MIFNKFNIMKYYECYEINRKFLLNTNLIELDNI